MKRIIPFFALMLLFSLSSFSKTDKDYHITLAVNMEDCLNCNKTLFDLEAYKEKYHVRVVFRKEYESDSTFIFNNYNFKDVASEVLWSDSLFGVYSPTGGSYVNIESKYSVNIFSVRINDIYNRDFFTFLSNQNKTVDTLFKEYPGIARGVSQLTFNESGLLGLNVHYKKIFSIYDIMTQAKQYDISMTEKILKKSFSYNDHKYPISDYDAQQKAMTNAGVPAIYGIADYCFIGDTILLNLNNQYFALNAGRIADLDENDTLLESNYALLKYYNGKLISMNRLAFHTKVDGQDYFAWPGMHHHDGSIYSHLGVGIDPSPERYYRALIELDNDGVYKLDVLKDRKLPVIYAKTQDFSMQISYKNAFCFIIIGRIYDIKENKFLEHLDFFENPTEIHPNRSPRMFINDFVMNDDYVWVTISDGDKKVMRHYYKMNRHTRKYEISKKDFDITKYGVIDAYDPLNPDYLIYKNKDNLLIREKIF